jgi:hypothetical protein
MFAHKSDRRLAAAAPEAAALLPFLLFACVIATDWARLLHYTIVIEACARNGALYASDAGAAARSPYKSVSEAALAEAPELGNSATVTASSATDSTGSPAVVVTVSVPFRTITNFPGIPNQQTLTRSVRMRVAPLATR